MLLLLAYKSNFSTYYKNNYIEKKQISMLVVTSDLLKAQVYMIQVWICFLYTYERKI